MELRGRPEQLARYIVHRNFELARAVDSKAMVLLASVLIIDKALKAGYDIQAGCAYGFMNMEMLDPSGMAPYIRERIPTAEEDRGVLIPLLERVATTLNNGEHING